MQDVSLTTGSAAASGYLQQLRALASALQSAMRAIAENDIALLEESVAEQAMICANLALLSKAFDETLPAAVPGSPASLEDPVGLSISSAIHDVRRLNLQYASLLKHSGRSLHLLTLLCRSYSGQIQEARGSRLKRQTWACEV